MRNVALLYPNMVNVESESRFRIKTLALYLKERN